MMKYEEIISYIKNEVARGNIRAGEKLPSIRNICDEFNCSKVTAVKALDSLKKDHLIYSIPHSGHYLVENRMSMENENTDGKIDFSTAAPDESILPYDDLQHCLSKALELYKENLFSTEYSKGLDSLICAVAKQLRNYQIFTSKQNVFITSGAQQAINILSMMPFQSGRNNVLVEQPTYYGMIKSLGINRIKAIGIQRTMAGLDLDELEKLFKKEDIKFFYTIPRFHNPTGFSYSNNEKKQILKLAERYDVYLVEDDYLADLETDSKADPFFAFDSSSRVIYLKSYSKVLLPGLRVAAVALPKNLTDVFESYKRWNDLNTSILSQGALEIYIKSGMYDAHMKILKKIYSGRMHFLNQITENINSYVKWNVPNSGFFASFEIKDTLRSKDFINRLRLKNVLLEDSDAFFIKAFTNRNLIRLSVSRVNENQIKAGVSAIINELT